MKSACASQVAHQVIAYPGFSSIKRQGVFLLSLDGMLVHRRVTPSIKFASTLAGERHCGSEVSCPRTQHNVPGKGSNQDHLLRSRAYQS